MPKITHIYSSDKEIDEIFDKGTNALHLSLELFSMIQHQDSCAKIIVKQVYKCFKAAEEAQKGRTPDED